MGTNNTQMIARQLQALATYLPGMADEDLLPTILDACDGLLAEVQKRRPAVSQLDQADLAQLMSGYTNISGHVGRFAGEIESSLGLGSAGQQLTDSMRTLADMQQKHSADTVQLKKLKANIEEQARINAGLEQNVSQYRNQLEMLKNFHAGLLSMQQSCSPQAIAKQESVNAGLLLQVTQQQQTLKDLEKQQQTLDGQLGGLRQKIASVQAAIDTLPAENTRLLEEYDSRKERLSRLQKAQTDCSPQKQQELEDEIASLKPQTEELERRMAQLENHRDHLSETKTMLDRQNQTMQTNVLELLNDSLGELNLLMTEHRSDLAAIKKEADDYQKTLDECRSIRADYADWCGADRSQLDAMLRALDQRESMELSKTLDVRNQDRIRKLFDQVENSLKELDRILTDCAAASRRDLSEIERKAGTR